MLPSAHDWLNHIRAFQPEQELRIMNVCGGHERSITEAGLRQILPPWLKLIPGPGCPVCICPEEDIDLAMRIALTHDLILTCFGDMLRVPINAPKDQPRSLEQARAQGADIRPIASPLDVLRIAQENPQRPVVFFAAGFETTMAPIAAMLLEGVPKNLSLLISGRLTWPAVAMLLQEDEVNFQGLVAPGHVATIMGAEEWRFVAEQHQLPIAVAGFTPESLLAAIASVLQQIHQNSPHLENCYPEVVRADGNPTARKHLASAFQVCDGNWRGIGQIPSSAFTLGPDFVNLDASALFPVNLPEQRRRAGEMPPGCDCASVVLGKLLPTECRLFGQACSPQSPVGPCMVSDEGACRIWWNEPGAFRDPVSA